MKIQKVESRKTYIQDQIERSSEKFLWCKVGVKDVLTYEKVFQKNEIKVKGPILCLGTRNGREIDLFRNILFGNSLLKSLIKFFQIRRRGYTSLFPFLESFQRSNKDNLDNESVIGLEINPEASRKDTLIGSFDDMPKDWADTFTILYSNSFDQSQDPIRTANEWKRVAAPGAIIIIGFTTTPPTDSDPVGDLTLNDFIELFGGEILYFSNIVGNYKTVIIKLN